jgi:hypothetical protein
VQDEPVRIKDALAPLGRQLGLRSPAEAAKIFSRWEEVVGREVADHARPSSLKHGILRIATHSSVWTTEISYLAEEIKVRANEVAGTEVVSDVRVWTSSTARETRSGNPIPFNEPAPPDLDRAAERASADSPEEALARARNAWEEARFRSSREASENQERPR